MNPAKCPSDNPRDEHTASARFLEDPPTRNKSRQAPENSLPVTGRKRILLAEDDADMRELLSWTLLDSEYEVDTVPDGTALCNRLANHLLHSDSERIDLVISDIRMPGYSGLEVITGLRKLEVLPPTILITAFGDEEIHRQADEIGVLLLDKPFEIDELLARVRELLES